MTNMLASLSRDRNRTLPPLDPRVEDRAIFAASLAIHDLREAICWMDDLPASTRMATLRESQAIEQHLANGTLLSPAFEEDCSTYADALRATGETTDVTEILERLDSLVMARLEIRDLIAAHRAVDAIASDPTTAVHWSGI